MQVTRVPSTTPESPGSCKVALHSRRATGVRPATLTIVGADQESYLHNRQQLAGILASKDSTPQGKLGKTIGDLQHSYST
eukprot:252663-Amphidinium_carterae.2